MNEKRENIVKRNSKNFDVLELNSQRVIGDGLTDELKKEIKEGVQKVIEEYGETLKLLGKN